MLCNGARNFKVWTTRIIALSSVAGITSLCSGAGPTRRRPMPGMHVGDDMLYHGFPACSSRHHSDPGGHFKQRVKQWDPMAYGRRVVRLPRVYRAVQKTCRMCCCTWSCKCPCMGPGRAEHRFVRLTSTLHPSTSGSQLGARR